MTDRPRLYPSHRHQWASLLRRSEAETVWCIICGFEAPRSLANLDGAMLNDAVYDEPDEPPDAKCLARWQRLGDDHLHRCEFIGRHAPPHRCRDCGELTYRRNLPGRRPDTDIRCDAQFPTGQCLDHQGHLGNHQPPSEDR